MKAPTSRYGVTFLAAAVYAISSVASVAAVCGAERWTCNVNLDLEWKMYVLPGGFLIGVLLLLGLVFAVSFQFAASRPGVESPVLKLLFAAIAGALPVVFGNVAFSLGHSPHRLDDTVIIGALSGVVASGIFLISQRG